MLGIGYLAWLDLRVQARFENRNFALPARIYARPLNLYTEMKLSPAQLVLELNAAGYHRVSRLDRPGSFERSGSRFRIATRTFTFWDGNEPARILELKFQKNQLKQLTEGNQKVPLVRLEPALIGRIYPDHREDRVQVGLHEVPHYLRAGVIAVEDREFHEHFGLSPRGILRASMVNLRAGKTVQGGSTITQQLAKNLFLSPARTLIRKLNEALISLILEARYTKGELLRLYLNEVYLGQEGQRAIHGFGLAARFYFGRRADELSVAESALLIGLVKGPSAYNPRRHPERALQRRNLVLDLMVEQGVISSSIAKKARIAPLKILKKKPKGAPPHPAFIDLIRRQLAHDYRDEDLRVDGLKIFTTLEPTVQNHAEETLSSTLSQLEKERRLNKLEGAIVVVNPRNGEIRALVGGRERGEAGFNRGLGALRPIGSLVKPATFLAALEEGQHTLISPLRDHRVTIDNGQGEQWTPVNYDGKYSERVPLIRALAESKNLAAVHLGMSIGLRKVRTMLERLGIKRPIPPYPSLLLGSMALTPFEVAQMYQTLANQGFHIPLRAIREVTDRSGAPLQRYPLDLIQTVQPESVFVLVHAMQAVMAEGTGRGARASLGNDIVIAGKTGTTDQLRDSWFAGFGENHLAVVWLGRDDNKPAGLSGASGAMRVWVDLMGSLNLKSLKKKTPTGVEWYWTDPETSSLFTGHCPDKTPMPFITGTVTHIRRCQLIEELPLHQISSPPPARLTDEDPPR